MRWGLHGAGRARVDPGFMSGFDIGRTPGEAGSGDFTTSFTDRADQSTPSERDALRQKKRRKTNEELAPARPDPARSDCSLASWSC